MNRDTGRPESAIWLLADSPPLIHAHKLDDPLDWRFPTRHNIWTPIETIVNRELFRLEKARIDDRKFFIRNAVESPEHWKRKYRHILAADIAEFKKLADKHQPLIILTFGQRAFEFARRSQGEGPRPFRHWTVAHLSGEFDRRLSLVREGRGFLVPLLHAVVAQQFETCHAAFGGDPQHYYEHVGCALAVILQGKLGNSRLTDLWM